MKTTFLMMVIIFACYSCQTEEPKRESVLDSISHVEDSIYYQFDSLPMLCDELGMHKQFIDIGDCKLYCEVEGDGIPLVLINGGPGGTHHCFHPWFSEMKDACKIVYYDQRGCGQSDFNKEDGYTFKQAVEDLDKLREKLGIEKWIVCGYSYGGALAQFYTALHPDNVLGMTLIGASPVLNDERFNGTRQYDYISGDEAKKIDEINELYSKGELTMTQRLYNKELNGDWKRQNFYKPTKEEILRVAYYEWVNDKGFNSTVNRSMVAYNFRHVFDNCPIPTLLCEGEWDLTWNENKKLVLKENHPNARFVVFKKAGHTIFSEETELFFSTLKEFVKSLKPVAQQDVANWQEHVDKIIAPQEELIKNEARFFAIINDKGIEEAQQFYQHFKESNEGKKLFSEGGMNSLGYSYLNKKEYEIAIKLFEMNVEAYPESWNVYDSLGEALLAFGNKEKAKENYQKSVELNPKNENGKKVLEGL